VFERYKIPAIILSVLTALVVYFYLQVDWEARAIRKQFDELVELVEKDGPVSTFESAGRGRKIVDFFTENPSVEYVPGRKLPMDLSSMSGAFISVWSRIDKASVRISRHEIEIVGARAVSTVTARCSVIIDGTDRMGGSFDYRIRWLRLEGEWRVQSLVALSAN